MWRHIEERPDVSRHPWKSLSRQLNILARWSDTIKKCDLCGRDEQVCRIKTIKGMNLCPKHITQYYRYGTFDDMTIYHPNDIEIKSDRAEIILRDKHCNEVGRAIIDLDDVEMCSVYKWHIRRNGMSNQYVMASLPNNKKIHLHRFVLGYSGSDDVDHINRNGLDNRKANLRIVPHSVNMRNNGKSGVKQVPSGKYQASCCRNYKTIYIGTFDTYDEAVYARKRFVEEYDKTVGQ